MKNPKMTLWALMTALFFLFSTAAASTEAEAQQIKVKGKAKPKKKRAKKTKKKRIVVKTDFFLRGGLGVSGCIDIGSSCSELTQNDRAFTLEGGYRYRSFGIGIAGSSMQLRLDAESTGSKADQIIQVNSANFNLFYFPSSKPIKTGAVDPWVALHADVNDLIGPLPESGLGFGLRGGLDLFLQDSDLAVTPSINYSVIFLGGSADPLHIWSAQIAIGFHSIKPLFEPTRTRQPKASSPDAPSPPPKPRPRH